MLPISLFYSDVAPVTGYITVISLPGVWSCTFVSSYVWQKCVKRPLPREGYNYYTDGFQMSIKHPTSGGQMCNQEAAVQRTFHLERSIFFFFFSLIISTRCSASLPVFCTQLHQKHTPTLALQKWSHVPWKPSTFSTEAGCLKHILLSWFIKTVFQSH